MVAGDQPVPRHLGAEYLQAGLPAVRQLRPGGSVSETRRRQSGEEQMSVLRAACSVLYVCALGMLVSASGPASTAQTSPGAGAILVLDTAKGIIEIETYPEEAPKTVARIVE